jgi:hypothetical protein
MMLFFVEDQCAGNHKHIFARNVDHAAEQFVAWQIGNEVEMGTFTIERVTIGSIFEPNGTHLRNALALGIEGIGSYDDQLGWTIRPVSDERSGRDWL